MDWVFVVIVPGLLGMYAAYRPPDPPCPGMICPFAFLLGALGGVLYKLGFPLKGDFGAIDLLAAGLTGFALASFVVGITLPKFRKS